MSFLEFKAHLKMEKAPKLDPVEKLRERAMDLLKEDMLKGRWTLLETKNDVANLSFNFVTLTHAGSGVIEKLVREDMNRGCPCDPRVDVIRDDHNLIQWVEVLVSVSADTLDAPDSFPALTLEYVQAWLKAIGAKLLKFRQWGTYTRYECQVPNNLQLSEKELQDLVKQSAGVHGIWVPQRSMRGEYFYAYAKNL